MAAYPVYAARRVGRWESYAAPPKRPRKLGRIQIAFWVKCENARISARYLAEAPPPTPTHPHIAHEASPGRPEVSGPSSAASPYSAIFNLSAADSGGARSASRGPISSGVHDRAPTPS